MSTGMARHRSRGCPSRWSTTYGTRLMMLQNGDADSIYLPASEEAQVSSDPNVRVVKGQPDLEIAMLGLNQQIDMAYNPGAGSDTIPADFFSSREVRLAFAYAYDEQRFIDDYLAGNGLPLNGIIPQGMAYHDPTAPTYQKDLVLAASYLNSASTGQGDTWGERGFRITLACNQGSVSRELQCTILKENLESLSDLGLVQGEINVTVLAMEWPSYLDAQRNLRPPHLLPGLGTGLRRSGRLCQPIHRPGRHLSHRSAGWPTPPSPTSAGRRRTRATRCFGPPTTTT